MSRNLKDILGNLEEPKPERQLKVVKDEGLEKILKNLFVIFEAAPDLGYSGEMFELYVTKIIELDVAVDQKLINNILLDIAAFEAGDEFANRAGPFISALVHVAYNQNHNNFEINVRHLNTPINWLGTHVIGTEERPLKLSMQGDFGRLCALLCKRADITLEGTAYDGFGESAKYSKVKVFGGVGPNFGANADHSEFFIIGNVVEQYYSTSRHPGGSIGMRAKDSKYKIIGKAGTSCLWEAKRCEAEIIGDLEDGCALGAEDCTVIIRGKAKANLLASEAKNSVFKCTDRDTLETIRKQASTGCRLYLLKGKEEKLFSTT